MLRSLKSRSIAGGILALGFSALLVLPGTVSASAGSSVPQLPRIPSTPLYDVGVPSSLTPAEAAAAVAPVTVKLPHFTTTVHDGAQTFTYSIVGKNPAVAQTTPLTTVPTYLVPLVIKFSNGDTWDPTVADSCDPGHSVLSRVTQSPIFANRTWKFGATTIGTSQLTSAFQRAEFWKFAKPTGINPTYGVQLARTTLPKIIVNVPNADAAVGSGVPCGNTLLGAVNLNWLDNYLQSTVIPSLSAHGVNASNFPFFLTHNVVEYEGSTSNCCVLGYHNAYAPSAGVAQTYGISMYDNSSEFSGSSDISAITHEVGEWANDPYVNNPTKPWGHIGQVSGCQNNLEVGDPLSGTTFPVKVGTFTYHPQELAFFSWFYHQSPSLGVNGWYSDKGTFHTAAAPCT